MNADQEKHERGQLQHAAEHAKPRKKVSVVAYLAILFCAAFLLLLLSYFMQQRANQDALDDLKQTSVSAVQSLDNLLTERDSLKEQVDALQQALEQNQNDADQTQAQLTQVQNTLTKQVQAMDYLRRIQQFYYNQSYRSARTVIDQFEASGLKAFLPTETVYQNESGTVLSPAEEYLKIYDALY